MYRSPYRRSSYRRISPSRRRSYMRYLGGECGYNEETGRCGKKYPDSHPEWCEMGNKKRCKLNDDGRENIDRKNISKKVTELRKTRLPRSGTRTSTRSNKSVTFSKRPSSKSRRSSSRSSLSNAQRTFDLINQDKSMPRRSKTDNIGNAEMTLDLLKRTGSAPMPHRQHVPTTPPGPPPPHPPRQLSRKSTSRVSKKRTRAAAKAAYEKNKSGRDPWLCWEHDEVEKDCDKKPFCKYNGDHCNMKRGTEKGVHR